MFLEFFSGKSLIVSGALLSPDGCDLSGYSVPLSPMKISLRSVYKPMSNIHLLWDQQSSSCILAMYFSASVHMYVCCPFPKMKITGLRSQWIKRLLHNHEDLGSDPQKLYKSLASMAAVYDPSSHEAESRTSRTSWLARSVSLQAPNPASGSAGDPKYYKVPRQRLSSISGFHRHVHPNVQTCMHSTWTLAQHSEHTCTHAK